MKISVEGSNIVELKELAFGDSFVYNGDIYIVTNAELYDEELGGRDTVYAVRLKDGFMDGFRPGIKVSEIDAYISIEKT